MFGYGTFCDAAWRTAIFGADYPWEAASLVGWRRIAIPDRGYLSIARSELDVVDGVLVQLDEIGWRIANAWEEVPIYRRVPVDVRTTTGPVAAFVYVFDNPIGAQPFDHDGELAVLSRIDVERSIRSFQPTRDALRRFVDGEHT
jgi:Gamma-glutamyl cyclotransferase, AIG2-like